MKLQVPILYKSYGQYINKFRSFPLLQDGLKIVERRILYSLYEKAREHFTKSAKIAGHVIGNYHPHSDASVYGSLVTMVNSKLAEGQGNWGSKIGIIECSAAASRYTEVRCSKEILDMAFEYIKHVRFEELEMDSEPVYLATKYPFCLISTNDCQGIGFGSRTIIPSYTKADLFEKHFQSVAQSLLKKQPSF
jgi:topoisomerase-4 subunit A